MENGDGVLMSYDPTLPTDKDYVRFVLGDTDTTAELLPDAQILAVLSTTSRNGTVALLAQGLAARYAQQPTSVSVSGKSVAWAERVAYWRDLAANGGAVPGGGAFSVTPTRTDGYAQLAADEAA